LVHGLIVDPHIIGNNKQDYLGLTFFTSRCNKKKAAILHAAFTVFYE